MEYNPVQPEPPDLMTQWKANLAAESDEGPVTIKEPEAEPAPSPAPVEAEPVVATNGSVTVEDVPMTTGEVGELIVKEAVHVKNALLRPLWRFGRQFFQSVEEGVDQFSDRLAGKKKDN